MSSTNATTLLLETLNTTLGTLPALKPWGVGFSGGRDSAVLLWALVRCVGAEGIEALHVDHGWRPKSERDEERASVELWCSRLGVTLRRFSPPTEPIDSEASARSHRYRCFQAFLTEHPGSAVFLAHHADDQAETILMRLLRGRSWQGLGGMAAQRGAFFRPFLGLPGSVLGQVAVDQNIPFHVDSTNLDEAPARNFLRLRVFPLLKERFPRALPALAEVAAAWRQMLPSLEVDPAWNFGPEGAAVATATWDDWNPVVRQAQLLAAATRLQGNPRLSRRFLEVLARSGRRSRGQGSGWSWSRSSGAIRWERVVQRLPMEYFVMAGPGIVYDLGRYRVSWCQARSPAGEPGDVFVSGIDPQRPLIWRSLVSGMSLSSADEGPWNRTMKKRRLGLPGAGRCALVFQDGFLKAAIDPAAKTVLWMETREEKLNNTGIFVTLVRRSDYER